MFLCIDVVMGMYKPFAPAASRVKTYYLLTILATIGSLIYFTLGAVEKENKG